MFLKKKIQMEGKFLFVYIVKKLQKVGEFIKLKQHLVGVKQDIGPCKSIPPNVDFKWKILCRSLLNPRKQPKKHMNYGLKVSQFEGDMPKCGEEVQDM